MNTRVAPPASPLRIWYGILGAPSAFGVLEMLGWLLSSGTCPRGSPEGYGGVPVLTNVRGILIIAAAVALTVSLGALLVGVADWRRSQDAGIAHIKGYWRPDFLAAAAMLISFVFTLSVCLMSIPIFWLPQCQIMR